MATEKEHLERLIFEVYGAEEAKSKIDKLRETEEKHAKSLRGLRKEAKAAAREEIAEAKEVAEAQRKRAEETTAALKKSGAALAALAVLAGKAAADLDTAQGKFERSARKAGLSVDEMTTALALSDKESRKYGRGLIEGREQLSALIDVTGDYKTALEDQARIQDIVATGDANAEQALELLTKARKGEVAELIKLDGFNRDNIEALNKIEDRATRTALAMEILTDRYKGAAKELADTNTAMDNLKQSGTDLLAVIGDTGGGLINAFSEFLGIIKPGQSLLDQFATGMRNFASEAKEASSYLDTWVEWQKQGAIWGDKSFAEVMSEMDTARALRDQKGGGKPGDPKGDGPPQDREIDPRLYGFIGPEQPKPKEKKKRGGRKRDEPTLDGFIGDFGSEGQTLEEAAGAEAQAMEEAEDRRQTFLQNKVNAEREAAEEIKRIYADQEDFKAKLEDNQRLNQKAHLEDLKETTAKENELRLAAADAAIGAASSIGSSLASLAGSEKAALAVQATTAIAQAGIAAALALLPGPPGGPHYAPGAIALGAAALDASIKAGVGIVGNKKPQSKMGGNGGGPSLQSDRERVSLQNEQSRSRESRQSQTHVVNVYSTFGPSPQQSRELVDTVERELRNRTNSPLVTR